MADLVAKKVDDVPLDPAADAWADAAPVNVVLSPQTITTPSGGGAVPQVEMRALHNGEAFAVRVTWSNPTSESSVAVRAFRDSCALMFPTTSGPLPSPFMGDRGKPVLIWQWKPEWENPTAAEAARVARYPEYMDYYNPANDAENAKFGDRPRPTDKAGVVVAEGFGSVTRVGDDQLEVRSSRDGEFTRVVFRRGLPVTAPNLVVGAQGSINVAVWDGATQERGSRKNVSYAWTPLLLEGQPDVPGTPEGPGLSPVAPVVVLGVALLAATVLFGAGMAQTSDFRKQLEEQKRQEKEAAQKKDEAEPPAPGGRAR